MDDSHARVEIPRPAIDALRTAHRIMALTGAGISAESGLPTFREKQTGLWARYRPEDLATPQAFARDPALVWRWYAWRRSLVAAAEPNAGHIALVAIEGRVAQFTLITQNVDGLHQRAGSRDVVELHGNVERSRCSVEGTIVTVEPDTVYDPPPRCGSCGGALRPDVVWFGESLPGEALARATEAASTCDALLLVGTSGVVYPAAALAPLALRRGATVIAVNPDASASPRGALAIVSPAAIALPALLAAAWSPAGGA
jgi:NAD-dependent deacetylase